MRREARQVCDSSNVRRNKTRDVPRYSLGLVLHLLERLH